MSRDLPDCDALLDVSLSLTDVERAELVQRLFEKGPAAIDDFIREKQAEKGSSIAAAITRFRSLLEEQARRMREKMDDEYSRRFLENRAQAEQKAREISKEEAEAEDRRRRLRDELGSILADGLLAEPLVQIVASATPAPEKPAAWWARAWRKVTAVLAAIAAALRRFWRWLLRRSGRERPLPDRKRHSGALLIELPSLDGTLSGLDARFEGALLTSPDLRKGIEARVRQEAGPWRRLQFGLAKRFGTGAYGRMAREAFKRQLLKLLSRRKKEAELEEDELEKRIRDLREKRSGLDRGLRAEQSALESEKDRLLRDMGKRLKLDSEKRVRENLEEDLSRSGLISRDAAGRIQITARLIDRFAEIVLAGEIRNLPSRYTFALGRTPVNQGTFERDRLKMLDEVSRMDLVESLLMARLTHPSSRHLTEEDIRVNRELSGSILHVVLVFDKSSSMAENNRLVAAKKAVLALFKAVKRKDRRNTVDLVGFDTEVRPMDLVQVWESRPSGFTNTAGALRVAHDLVQKSAADLKLIYLITDGFPEAYTENGRNIAGDNDKSLALALAEARELGRVRNVRLVHILLEPKERIFVEAAEKIVDAAHGKLITTDPNRLAADMLIDYSGAVT